MICTWPCLNFNYSPSINFCWTLMQTHIFLLHDTKIPVDLIWPIKLIIPEIYVIYALSTYKATFPKMFESRHSLNTAKFVQNSIRTVTQKSNFGSLWTKFFTCFSLFWECQTFYLFLIFNKISEIINYF